MTLAYAAVCLAPLLRQRRKRVAARRALAEAAQSPGWIVAYASQTGNAEELAAQTLATLRLAGIPAQLSELSDLVAADLQRAERVLFLVSTYGEGDAPDGAAVFAGRLMGSAVPLPHLHYAVLALGDRAYAHFCGFGRALDRWLEQQGAQALFPRIEVDRSAASAVAQWHQRRAGLERAGVCLLAPGRAARAQSRQRRRAPLSSGTGSARWRGGRLAVGRSGADRRAGRRRTAARIFDRLRTGRRPCASAGAPAYAR